MRSVGRNDPCPCGSGRKYKHCCLRRDRKIEQLERAVARFEFGEQNTVKTVHRLVSELNAESGAEHERELESLFAAAEAMADFETRREAIEEASDKLESHRAEFEALMYDSQSALDHAMRLFSEETFAPFRYTPEDLNEAFSRTRFPRLHREEIEPADMEAIVGAMLSMVDEKDRLRLSLELFMLLPDYVDAGRYMDAWMIQLSAVQMVEEPERGNPFLTSLVFQAYDAWWQQLIEESDEMYRAFGADPEELNAMTEDERIAWLEAQITDPEKRAQLESQYRDRSLLMSQTQATLEDIEQEAIALLEREDSARLALSEEELEPWIHTFFERLGPQIMSLSEAASEGREPDEATVETLRNEIVDIIIEMTESIFTPERLRQLGETLKAYHDHLQSIGEQEMARLAYVVSTMVSHEEEPSYNPFVIMLCHHSLLEAIDVLSEQSASVHPET
jgi:hypothetical protein